MAASSSSAAHVDAPEEPTSPDFGGSETEEESTTSLPAVPPRPALDRSSLPPTAEPRPKYVPTGSPFQAAGPDVPWVRCTVDRLDREDARHREQCGDGQLGLVGASAAYQRGLETDELIVGGCRISGTEGLSPNAMAAARELQKVCQLGKVDPSFECARHTLVVHGRPVQVFSL